MSQTVSITIPDCSPLDLETLAQWLRAGRPQWRDYATAKVIMVPNAPPAAADPPVPAAPSTPAAAAPPPAATTPPLVEREPGSDDDVVADKPDDDVFKRCPNLKEIVKEIVRRGTTDETAVRVECERLREVGVPVLKAISDDETLTTRVHIQLISLGVIEP